ncbi:transient receptor potential cation channel subfamily V member 3-like isoform X2 [Pristis pectinata]|uniref:transient receptor potential cation channel subfamily V member 3-like isoform X2 n=1 Tax=Pristis pectinata TaxID=685728 RepID=UPI00223CBEEE|nr:transient receptor potential cation channel subfamily V member 3-like isoform X2 [Pristis pectinata]
MSSVDRVGGHSIFPRVGESKTRVHKGEKQRTADAGIEKKNTMMLEELSRPGSIRGEKQAVNISGQDPSSGLKIGKGEDRYRAMDYNLSLLLQPDSLDGSTEAKRKKRLKHNMGDQLSCSVAEGNMEKFNSLLRIIQITRMKLTEPWFSDYKTGKTCLMKALLNLNSNTQEMVKKLILAAENNGCLNQLINAEYIDKDYKGQTALHIAIERRCPDIVRLLLEKGADVNARATGKFFKLSRKRCGFYFGELPLALAACTNQPETVSLLMSYQGTKVGEQDSEGNTVLHALVTVADDTEDNTKFVTEMYNKILIENKGGNLEEVRNVKGLTPLQLAAKLGKFEIFRNILNREIIDKQHSKLSRKVTDWAYGPVSSSLYDLTGVDTTEKKSVLKIVVFNTKIQNRHLLLSVEPLNTLLQQKWEKFAVYMFTASCVLYILYITIFTTIYYDQSHTHESLFQMNATTTSQQFSGRVLILLWACVLLIMEVVMISQLRFSDLQSVVTEAWFHILFFLQAGLVACSAVLYWLGADLHRATLMGALALGWINVLYYTRGFQSMGIYSVMLQKILLSDVVHFLFVYLLFLIGFSAALASLIQRCHNTGKCSPFDSFTMAMLELFKLTIGLGDLEIQSQALYPNLFLFLLVLYVVLTFILLLNMLIALMGDTVGNLSKDSKNIWKLQRARTILNLEEYLPKFLKKKFQLGIVLNGKRYIRINEVNWTAWSTSVARIREDPGEEEGETTCESSDEADRTLLPPSESIQRRRFWARGRWNLGPKRRHRERVNRQRRAEQTEINVISEQSTPPTLEATELKEADDAGPSGDTLSIALFQHK